MAITTVIVFLSFGGGVGPWGYLEKTRSGHFFSELVEPISSGPVPDSSMGIAGNQTVLIGFFFFFFFW